MEPLTEGLEPFRADQVEASDRQHMTHRRVECSELEVGELPNEPLERHGAVIGLERLEEELRA